MLLMIQFEFSAKRISRLSFGVEDLPSSFASVSLIFCFVVAGV